jgi:hypothetical protein
MQWSCTRRTTLARTLKAGIINGLKTSLKEGVGDWSFKLHKARTQMSWTCNYFLP